jgi:uncharacterized membrane protein
MSDDLLTGVILFSAIGSGIVAGVLFAFSTFVMRALDRLPAAQGLAAMQSINITVLNPAFGLAFGGTAVTSAVLAAAAAFRWDEPESGLLLAGSLCYLVGGIGLTIAFHVADLEPTGADSAARWHHYVAVWTAGNHVRTLASAVAAVLFTVAL